MDMIVCPHCGYEEHEPPGTILYDGIDTIIKCESCGKNVRVMVSITVDIDCLIPEDECKHNWETIHWTFQNIYSRSCEICGKYEESKTPFTEPDIDSIV